MEAELRSTGVPQKLSPTSETLNFNARRSRSTVQHGEENDSGQVSRRKKIYSREVERKIRERKSMQLSQQESWLNGSTPPVLPILHPALKLDMRSSHHPASLVSAGLSNGWPPAKTGLPEVWKKQSVYPRIWFHSLLVSANELVFLEDSVSYPVDSLLQLQFSLLKSPCFPCSFWIEWQIPFLSSPWFLILSICFCTLFTALFIRLSYRPLFEKTCSKRQGRK